MDNDLEKFILKLEKIIDKLTAEEDKEDLGDLLDRFFNLDYDYQLQLVNSLKEPIEEKKEEEHIKGWLTCLKEGHDWSNWGKDYQKEKFIYYQSRSGRRIIKYEEVPIWKRKCIRCGIEERRDYKDIPDEIKALRNKTKELLKKYDRNKPKK